VSTATAVFITTTTPPVYSAGICSHACINKGEKNKGKNDLLGSYYLGYIF
jgi:hypothetical protein